MIVSSRAASMLIVLSLGLALILALLPLPAPLAAGRPAFYLATVLFWVLMQPVRFGLLAAWGCGLCLDVLYATPLAEHGLALAVAAYLTGTLRAQLQSLPRIQQALLLAPVFAAYEFILFWIDGVAGTEVGLWWRWLPVATTTLLWPFWAYLLQKTVELEI